MIRVLHFFLEYAAFLVWNKHIPLNLWYEARFGDFALKHLANDDSAFGVAHACLLYINNGGEMTTTNLLIELVVIGSFGIIWRRYK